MRLTVALVADDLTGALDAAAPFAGRGFGVTVHRSPNTLPAPGVGADGSRSPEGSRSHTARTECPGTVLAVSTSSRHLAPAAARAAVAAAGRRLRGWSPRLVFKKIDSTLRGPIPDEVEAAMEAFGRRAALVCPAFPFAGRIVRDGEVVVHGEPLRETEYARDLRTPSPAVSMAALFESGWSGTGVAAGRRPSGRSPSGASRSPTRRPNPIWPASGRSYCDMRRKYSRSDRMASRPASRVSSVHPGRRSGSVPGMGASFSSRSGPAPGQRRTRPSGCGVRTRKLRYWRRRPGCWTPTRWRVRPAALRPCSCAIPPDPRGAPGEVARAFADGIRAAVERVGGPGHLAALVATGGDTVEAILDTFGVGALDVLGEFRPGIPVSRTAPGEAGFTLVSKAGGFGTPDLFAEIASEMAAP